MKTKTIESLQAPHDASAAKTQQPLKLSRSQSIGVKYAKEGMQLRQHGAGEEKGIEPYDNH
jgi:hypothetical protein